MIINIPLEINEKLFDDVLIKDYSNKIYDALMTRAEASIKRQARGYYRQSIEDGLVAMTQEGIDRFIEENKDAIIEAAAEKLAQRLAKTKAAKEVIAELKDTGFSEGGTPDD